jgi:signal transduction histidine kinase
VLTENVARGLHDRADAVAAVLEPSGMSIRMRETPGESFESEVWVYDAAGTLVEGGDAPPRLRHTLAELSTSASTTTRDAADWSLRALPVRFEGAAGPSGVVVVGVPLAPYRTTETVALLLSAGIGALVVAGVTLWTREVVRRALAPVATMAQRAAEWSETDLTRRFGLGVPRDEITRLGTVLDSLLDRVAQAITAEQRLSAELAHELRTPLTVIRAEAELSLTDARVAPSAGTRLEQIVAAADDMADVIDTLLSLARGTMPALEVSSAAEVLDRVADAYTDVDVDVVVSPDVPVAAPATFAVRALAPLVENAVRHAAGRVELEAVPRPGQVEFVVRDDGPGLVEIDESDLFRPGTRGAGSAGAGLGLSLARRLARAAGGDVEYRGGAPTTFVLRLPAAPATA